LLEKIELSNLTIRLCTNGTHLLNDKFKSQLKNVKKLILTVSLDGIHSVNDWYRWPSKFNSIIDNIKSYDGFQHNNIDKRIHCVINVINVLYLPEIINFVQDKLPGWTLEWDWIIYPDWQHASVLPKEIKFKLIDEFIKFNKVFSSKTLSNPYPVTINILLQENNRWNELKRNVTILSSDRNLDFLEMVPKFKDIWLL
jgi:sulfatase maturation enzyme AslB (radical SAM superfamily)